MSKIETEIEKILNYYCQGDHYELLRSAKKEFTDATGKIDEEIPEYELRMNSFNDWYLFNYKLSSGRTIIEDHIERSGLDDELSKALSSTNYSLFIFHKRNFRKQIVLKDLVSKKSFVLSKSLKWFGMVEDDIFVGRVIEYLGENFLLKGVCPLPYGVISNLKKEAKKVRKNGSPEAKEKFLLELERLKTKSLQYQHIDAAKIFVFDA